MDPCGHDVCSGGCHFDIFGRFMTDSGRRIFQWSTMKQLWQSQLRMTWIGPEIISNTHMKSWVSRTVFLLRRFNGGHPFRACLSSSGKCMRTAKKKFRTLRIEPPTAYCHSVLYTRDLEFKTRVCSRVKYRARGSGVLELRFGGCRVPLPTSHTFSASAETCSERLRHV